MAEAAIQPTVARLDRGTAAVGGPGVIGTAAAWVLWAVSFNVLDLFEGDSLVQYTFLRRLFGEDVDAVGYHFGLALLEAPFFALAKLLEGAGLATVDGVPVEEAAVALGSSLYVLAAILVCGWLLAKLELPYRGTTLFLATFGTPLFFYGTFIPGKTHAFDAFLFTVALALLLTYMRSGLTSVPLLVWLGLVLGLSATVRYISAAALVALVLGLLVLRRPRAAAILAGASVATGAALLIVPWTVGVALTGGGYNEDVLSPDLLAPLKMLFTEHRGLFVWSPVALLGVIGYVLLLRRWSADRAFLALAGSMGVAIILSYAAVPFWDGTWSFSQRFFTPLFPLVAIGLAALAAIRPRLTLAVASLVTAWSVYLALTLQTVGPPHDNYKTIEGGAFDLAVQPAERDIGPGAYVWGVRNLARFVP